MYVLLSSYPTQYITYITNITCIPHQAIQSAIRSSLAHVKHSRIAPSAINAPPPGFVPPSLGVGLPSVDDANMDDGQKSNAGLQEERLGRDAWEGILAALKKIEAGHEAEESGVRGEGDKMEE